MMSRGKSIYRHITAHISVCKHGLLAVRCAVAQLPNQLPQAQQCPEPTVPVEVLLQRTSDV